MTPDQLRQFPGFEDKSEAELLAIIADMKELAAIFFESFTESHEQPQRIQPVRRQVRAA